MNRHQYIIIFCFSFFTLFTGCQTDGGIKALAQDGTYYTAVPDLRLCASPLCGGWFVQAVNSEFTRCADGQRQTQCYVAQEDASALGLTTEQQAVLRQAMGQGKALLKGRIDPHKYDGFGNLGLLTITHAWIGAVDKIAKGTFAGVSDNGVRCVTDPCESYTADIFNTKTTLKAAALDFSTSGATTDQIQQAITQVGNGELAVAGTNYTVSGTAGSAIGIKVDQFYFELTGKPAACLVTGCSSQVCADDHIITTCEWRAEYACYKTAECTRQSNGACGWTQDKNLIDCLNSSTGLLQ